MLISLQNGETVHLPDHLCDLSDFLLMVADEDQPLKIIEHILRENHSFSIEIPGFLSFLEDKVTTIQDLEQIFLSHSPLSQLIKDTYPDCRLLLYLQTTGWDSRPMAHRFKSIKDEILLLVIEYLSIQSQKRDTHMFDDLPFRMQTVQHGTSLSSLVDSELTPYVDFINKLADHPDTLLELLKAASLFGIKSLTCLIACYFAKYISENKESTVRKRFQIPDKFRNSTMEKLRELVNQEEWRKYCSAGNEIKCSPLPFMQTQLDEDT